MSTPAVLKVREFQVQFPGLKIETQFEVAPGERLVVAGPSGCGKTTLFRFVAGLPIEGFQRGQVWLGDVELTGLAPEKRGLGVVVQEALVFPQLSVLENAAFGLKMRGVSFRERQRQASEWCERLGLARVVGARAESLSGGERQRLALIRAVIWKPAALLLDEPFSALDPQARAALGAALLELHAAHPVPLLLVTHDRDEAARLGTRVLSLQ